MELDLLFTFAFTFNDTKVLKLCYQKYTCNYLFYVHYLSRWNTSGVVNIHKLFGSGLWGQGNKYLFKNGDERANPNSPVNTLKCIVVSILEFAFHKKKSTRFLLCSFAQSVGFNVVFCWRLFILSSMFISFVMEFDIFFLTCKFDCPLGIFRFFVITNG